MGLKPQVAVIPLQVGKSCESLSPSSSNASLLTLGAAFLLPISLKPPILLLPLFLFILTPPFFSSSFFPITHSAGIARMYFRKLFGLAQSRIKWGGYRRYPRWVEETIAEMDKLPGYFYNEDPPTDSFGGRKSYMARLRSEEKTSVQMEKLPGNYDNEDPFKIFVTPHTDPLKRYMARRRSEHLPQLPLDAPIRAAVCPEPVTSITTLPNKLRVATRTVNEIDATVSFFFFFL